MKKTNLKYYLDARLTTKVRLVPSKKTFEHKDARRSIVGLVNHLKFPFPIQQIKIYEKEFYGGDVAIIPPGCILAFVPLSKEARLIEISNKDRKSVV